MLLVGEGASMRGGGRRASGRVSFGCGEAATDEARDEHARTEGEEAPTRGGGDPNCKGSPRLSAACDGPLMSHPQVLSHARIGLAASLRAGVGGGPGDGGGGMAAAPERRRIGRGEAPGSEGDDAEVPSSDLVGEGRCGLGDGHGFVGEGAAAVRLAADGARGGVFGGQPRLAAAAVVVEVEVVVVFLDESPTRLMLAGRDSVWRVAARPLCSLLDAGAVAVVVAAAAASSSGRSSWASGGSALAAAGGRRDGFFL